MNRFWREQPALLWAICLLIGTSTALFWTFPWNWAFPLLWALYLISLRSWAPIALLIGGVLYSTWLYSPASVTGKSTEAIGYFSIASLEPYQSAKNPVHGPLSRR